MGKKIKSDQKAAFTKLALKKAVGKGSRNLAKTAIAVRGYSVVVKDGWVVRINANGRIVKKITAISRAIPTKKILD